MGRDSIICNMTIVFRSFQKLKWRNADNRFHYSSDNPEYHWYSEDAIEGIIVTTQAHEKKFNF